MSFLRLIDVAFTYRGFDPVVLGVSLELAAGEIHCLVGRSGCGKTTLLKLAAGLLRPTRGQVRLRDRPLVDRREIGFVFQSPTLLDWLSVRGNVLLPVSLQRSPTAEDGRAADAMLAQLQLEGHGARYPRQLSGGQQSRVALARALLLRPPLLLLDEPFAALDAITREDLQRDLLRVCRAHGAAALFVTHDIAEAVLLGDRISVMAGGRLASAISVDRSVARDTAAFAAACGAVREALGLERVPA